MMKNIVLALLLCSQHEKVNALFKEGDRSFV